MADGAHGQGCTGHHTNGGVRERLNPLCMQAFAEQSIDKPVGILKLRRPHADNHWYLPRRVTGRLLYCKSVFNPLRPLMPIFPINRRVSILFGKIFCLFDSFITQHPRKMRGCLRPILVISESVMPTGRSLERIPSNKNGARAFVSVEAQQKTRKSDDSPPTPGSK